MSARSVACLLLLACRRLSGPSSTLRWDDGAQASVEEPILEQARALDRFLASIEKRAFRMARIALRHDEDALDSVQDAMLQLARRYGRRPERGMAPAVLPHFAEPDSRLSAPPPGPGPDHGVAARAEVAGRREPRRIEYAAVPDRAPLPAEQLAADQAMQTLERSLAELPGRQQEAFMLRASRAWTLRRPRPRWDAAKAASRHTIRGPCIRCASSWELRGERRA